MLKVCKRTDNMSLSHMLEIALPSKPRIYFTRPNKACALKIPKSKVDTFNKRTFPAWWPLVWNALPHKERKAVNDVRIWLTLYKNPCHGECNIQKEAVINLTSCVVFSLLLDHKRQSWNRFLRAGRSKLLVSCKQMMNRNFHACKNNSN